MTVKRESLRRSVENMDEVTVLAQNREAWRGKDHHVEKENDDKDFSFGENG